MIFLLIRFVLSLIGVIFLLIFMSSSVFLYKIVYSSDTQIIEHIFNNYEFCAEDYEKSNKEICENIVTSYWIILISITSLVMAFLTLFPVFIMKKRHVNETRKKNS